MQSVIHKPLMLSAVILNVVKLSDVVPSNKYVIKHLKAKLKSLELFYVSTIYLKHENFYKNLGKTKVFARQSILIILNNDVNSIVICNSQETETVITALHFLFNL
jgi:hypothetical protein